MDLSKKSSLAHPGMTPNERSTQNYGGFPSETPNECAKKNMGGAGNNSSAPMPKGPAKDASGYGSKL